MLTYNNRYLCILSLCFNLLILHVIMDLLLFIYNNGYIQIVTWFVSVYVFKCVERECLLGVVHNCWVGDCKKCYRLMFLGYILNYVVHEFVIFTLICLKLLLSYIQLWIGIVYCLGRVFIHYSFMTVKRPIQRRFTNCFYIQCHKKV